MHGSLDLANSLLVLEACRTYTDYSAIGIGVEPRPPHLPGQPGRNAAMISAATEA